MKCPLIAATLVASAAAARANASTYAIDPTHTFAYWGVLHFGTSTSRGRFAVKEGQVQFDRAAKAGAIEVILDTTAPNSGVAELDKQLASKDFFDSANFPTGKFVAAQLRFNGDKVVEAAGMLTLRGKTHPVTLRASNFNCYDSPVIKREVCGGDFEATVKRSLWGISWGLDMGLPDEVRLLVQVEAVKQ